MYSCLTPFSALLTSPRRTCVASSSRSSQGLQSLPLDQLLVREERDGGGPPDPSGRHGTAAAKNEAEARATSAGGVGPTYPALRARPEIRGATAPPVRGTTTRPDLLCPFPADDAILPLSPLQRGGLPEAAPVGSPTMMMPFVLLQLALGADSTYSSAALRSLVAEASVANREPPPGLYRYRTRVE